MLDRNRVVVGGLVAQEKTIEELGSSRWRFNPLLFPGPDRSQILYVKDIVLESPSGENAAVVYSISEITNNWYVGLLALISGDTAAPYILLRPNNFGCTPNLRWLGGDRFLNVQMSMYHRVTRRHDIPFCILDLKLQMYTFIPFRNPCATIEPEGNVWVVREWERAKAFRPRHGEIIDSQRVRWLPWSEIDQYHDKYFEGIFGRP